MAVRRYSVSLAHVLRACGITLLLLLVVLPVSRAAAATVTAPVLTVDGPALRWNKVADITRYVLATKVPGQATAYRVVTGTSTTPSAVAGNTVTYGLRADATDSAW